MSNLEETEYLIEPTPEEYYAIKDSYKKLNESMIDLEIEAQIYRFMYLFPNHDPERLGELFMHWQCIHDNKMVNPERINRIMIKMWDDIENKYIIICEMNPIDKLQRFL